MPQEKQKEDVEVDDRIQRLRQVDSLILEGPVSRPMLSQITGVSIDTVRRDIQLLQALGSNAVFIHGIGWKSTKPVFTTNLNNG